MKWQSVWSSVALAVGVGPTVRRNPPVLFRHELFIQGTTPLRSPAWRKRQKLHDYRRPWRASHLPWLVIECGSGRTDCWAPTERQLAIVCLGYGPGRGGTMGHQKPRHQEQHQSSAMDPTLLAPFRRAKRRGCPPMAHRHNLGLALCLPVQRMVMTELHRCGYPPSRQLQICKVLGWSFKRKVQVRSLV
jgi:hypothetical protein